MEHWLPLFQERMDTLFDYLGNAPVAIEPQGEDAARERFKTDHRLLRGPARGDGALGGGRSTSVAAAGFIYRGRMDQAPRRGRTAAG